MGWMNFWKKHETLGVKVPDLRPSFLLPHNGAEIWIACLDNFDKQVDLIQVKILDTEQLIGRPSRSTYVLYHLEDTVITIEVASLIIESLIRCSDHIRKLAFVGVSKSGRKALRSYSIKLNLKITSEYFLSMDEAKNWLARE